ncbi:MAG: DUF4625 domain-containing protein [Prevotellaceae bacterium]|jgi:hypothetical protein|nr:DUF4625 domain-containing protein [Prevotellaceae bacterium]
MKKIFQLTVAVLAGCALAGCSHDETTETTGPVITLHEPEENQPFTAGNAHGVHLEFDLADESGLNQYKIDIHYGEGHTHSQALQAQPQAARADWSYQKTYEDAKGLKNHHVHVHSDSIPENASLGAYHLGIWATDIHGNESVVYRTFTVVDYPVEDDDED